MKRKVLAFLLALVLSLTVIPFAVSASPGNSPSGATDISLVKSDTFSRPGDGIVSWYKFRITQASKVVITIKSDNFNPSYSEGAILFLYDHANDSSEGEMMWGYIGETGTPLRGTEYLGNMQIYVSEPSQTGAYYLDANKTNDYYYIRVSSDLVSGTNITVSIDSIDPLSNTGSLNKASAATVNPDGGIVKQHSFTIEDKDNRASYWYKFTISSASKVTIKQTRANVVSDAGNTSMLLLCDQKDEYLWGTSGGDDVDSLGLQDSGAATLSKSITYRLPKGTYYVRLDLHGSIEGVEHTLAFTQQIVPATKSQMTCSLTAKTFNGKAQGVTATPKTGVGKVTVYYTGTGGTTYAKSTSKPKTAGSYAVTADVAEGALYAAATNIALGTFTIKKADISKAKVAAIANKTWTGKQIKPSVTSFKFNGFDFKTGDDAAVSYGTNKAIGKGAVKLTGKGNFTGTKTVSFKINPKKNAVSKIEAGSRQMKVTWSRPDRTAQGITKYQMRYRVKGATSWKSVKTYSASTSSATVKSLTKGKQYQVQVRSYKTVSGVKYYSAWSAAKTGAKIK